MVDRIEKLEKQMIAWDGSEIKSSKPW